MLACTIWAVATFMCHASHASEYLTARPQRCTCLREYDLEMSSSGYLSMINHITELLIVYWHEAVRPDADLVTHITITSMSAP